MQIYYIYSIWYTVHFRFCNRIHLNVMEVHFVVSIPERQQPLVVFAFATSSWAKTFASFPNNQARLTPPDTGSTSKPWLSTFDLCSAYSPWCPPPGWGQQGQGQSQGESKDKDKDKKKDKQAGTRGQGHHPHSQAPPDKHGLAAYQYTFHNDFHQYYYYGLPKVF